MTDATELDIDAIRARVEAAIELWAWHEATDDTNAGWGAHMGQMIYRLPVDGQTRDMQASILAMVADLSAALDEITRLRAALDEAEFHIRQLTESRDRAERIAEAAEVRLDTCVHPWHDGRSAGPCPGCGYLRPQDRFLAAEKNARAEAAERERDEARAEVERWQGDAAKFCDDYHAELERRLAAESAIRTLARSWSGRHDLLMTGDSAAHDIEAALATPTTTDGEAVTTEGDPS